MSESDNENWRSILSSKPSLKSPEGLMWLGVGTLLFTSCAIAVKRLDLAPQWAFTAGILFVLILEPVRERLAEKVKEREELIDHSETGGGSDG